MLTSSWKLMQTKKANTFTSSLEARIWTIVICAAAVVISSISTTAQTRTGEQSRMFVCPTAVTASQIDMLLSDVRKRNPDAIKRLAADASLREKQVENL